MIVYQQIDLSASVNALVPNDKRWRYRAGQVSPYFVFCGIREIDNEVTSRRSNRISNVDKNTRGIFCLHFECATTKIPAQRHSNGTDKVSCYGFLVCAENLPIARRCHYVPPPKNRLSIN